MRAQTLRHTQAEVNQRKNMKRMKAQQQNQWRVTQIPGAGGDLK